MVILLYLYFDKMFYHAPYSYRINARKTKEMIICFCRNDNHVASIPRIVLDDNDIERVTQAKVLGVTLSSDSWNAHVPLYLRLGSVFLLFTN